MSSVQQNTLKGRATKPFNPVASLLRHKFPIALLGSALLFFLIPLVLLISKPYYESSGKLRIAPVIPTFMSQTEDFSITAYYHDYVRTQVNRIRDHQIIEKALLRLPEGTIRDKFIPEGISPSFAATVLMRRLIVDQVRDTHLILLYLSGGEPEGLAEIINLIMDVYLEKVIKEVESKDNKRLAYLDQEKEQMEIGIAQQTMLMHSIAEEAGTSTFSEMYNVYARQLQDLQEAYTRVYGTMLEKQNIYRETLLEVETLRKLSIQPLVDEMVEKDQSLWDTSFWTYKTMQEMRASLDGVSVENPDKKYIDLRIEGMQKYLGQLRSDVSIRAKSIIKDKRDYELDKKIISTRHKYKSALNTEKELKGELERVKAKALNISQKMLTGQGLDGNLKHMRRLLERVDERRHDLKVESRAPGRITLESLARKPEREAGSNLKKLLALIFILSFGLSTVAAIFFDLMDNRVRNPADVVNALGFPPTWPISRHRSPEFNDIPFSQITLNDSASVAAKAIRSLAVRLDKERKDHDAKVVFFTGVDEKNGTTEIMLNTAHTMTQFCRRVLVVEANFESPKHALLLETEKTPGLVDLLGKDEEPKSSITTIADMNFDLIPAGNAKDDEFDNLKFTLLIEKFRESYDFIFLDSAPIMKSALTEFLVLQSDVGVLVIQGDKTLYRDLRRTTEIIDRLELPVFAAVLNWGGARNRPGIEVFISKITDGIKRSAAGQITKVKTWFKKS